MKSGTARSAGAPAYLLSRDGRKGPPHEQFGYQVGRHAGAAHREIVLNMGVGEAVADKKIMDNAGRGHDQDRWSEAAGHEGTPSVANFKIREGYPVGCKGRCVGPDTSSSIACVSVAMPRIRDFRGISRRDPSTAAEISQQGVKEQISSGDRVTTISTRSGLTSHTRHRKNRRRKGRHCCGFQISVPELVASMVNPRMINRTRSVADGQESRRVANAPSGARDGEQSHRSQQEERYEARFEAPRLLATRHL